MSRSLKQGRSVRCVQAQPVRWVLPRKDEISAVASTAPLTEPSPSANQAWPPPSIEIDLTAVPAAHPAHVEVADPGHEFSSAHLCATEGVGGEGRTVDLDDGDRLGRLAVIEDHRPCHRADAGDAVGALAREPVATERQRGEQAIRNTRRGRPARQTAAGRLLAFKPAYDLDQPPLHNRREPPYAAVTGWRAGRLPPPWPPGRFLAPGRLRWLRCRCYPRTAPLAP